MEESSISGAEILLRSRSSTLLGLINLNNNFSNIRAREQGGQAIQKALDSNVYFILGRNLALFYVSFHFFSKIFKTMPIRFQHKTLHPHLLAHHIQKIPHAFSFSPNLLQHWLLLVIEKPKVMIDSRCYSIKLPLKLQRKL